MPRRALLLGAFGASAFVAGHLSAPPTPGEPAVGAWEPCPDGAAIASPQELLSRLEVGGHVELRLLRHRGTLEVEARHGGDVTQAVFQLAAGTWQPVRCRRGEGG